MYIPAVHTNTKAYGSSPAHAGTQLHSYSRYSEFKYLSPRGSWLWPLRSLQMKRAWSVAEGPSINNKQQLSCVRPSVSRGTWSQAQHLRGVCSSFRLWSCLFQWLIKVWMCKYTQGCVSVFTAQHRPPLYCILKLAGSKKAELRVAGAKERGLPAHCRTAGSSPRSQLPGTGWEFQTSASLPRPSWRWARESSRNGRYTSEKNAKNNIWAYIKRALGDTQCWHTQEARWENQGHFI